MQPNIARATARDLPDLKRLITALCAFHGDPMPRGLADLQSRLIEQPGLTALMARHKGAAIGYAVIEQHWRPMETGDGFDIAHLYVVERWRSHGVGQALIAEARQLAAQACASRLTIGTSPDNPGAAAAYRRMGLTEQTGPSGPRFSIGVR